jgi:diguanylate cyclase (GGDEF)-like protein/PAS domain S-box-containing protein
MERLHPTHPVPDHPGTRWLPWTRHLALVCIVASALACAVLAFGPARWSPIGDFWIAAGCLATTVVAYLQGGTARSVTARRAWRLIGLGEVCQTLAHLSLVMVPSAAIPDLFAERSIVSNILTTLPLVGGLLFASATLRHPSERWKFGLDAAVSLVLGAMTAWFLLQRSAAGGMAPPIVSVSPALLLLPGLQLLALCALSSVYVRVGGGHRARRGLALVGTGLSAQAISHAIRLWQPDTRAVGVTMLDGLGAALILLGFLVEVNLQLQPRSAARRTPPALRNPVLPYLAVIAGAAMLLDAARRLDDTGELLTYIIAMIVLTVLVSVRQAIVANEDARRSSALAHEASETRFRSLVQHSTDLITILDGADSIRYASPAISRVFGYEPQALEGRALRELVHPDDVVLMLGFLTDAGKPGARSSTCDWRMRSASGAWCRVENVVVNLLDDDTVDGLVLTTRDVTHRVALEEQLVHRAFHDELTGLANRALFTNRVEQALLRASRNASRTAVLFVDLDDFKEINDSLGHAAGDTLLAQCADRLRACLRAGDTAARLGGDEFAVLVEECRDDGEEAMHAADRISRAFARPFALEEREAFATASVGVVISSGSESGEDLLRHADLAMYLAKKRGKARVERFAAHMHEEVVERLDLLADLRYAIERDELQLEYQPIVDLETRTVSGLETLVRWDHPRRGRIAPSDFIPIAEQSGLIVAIGRWVLLHACAHARHWSRSLPQLVPVTVTVNLSARQLGDEQLLDDVANALRVAGLRRDQLVLELTESTLLANSEETVGILTSLKSLGVRLAIDDFGTGYSSLSYLHRFPVDVLKIDKSFVDGVGGGPGVNALACAVIALGNSLNLRTVAEGIENEQQYAALLALGCKFGQGFLISRPLPPGDVMPFLLMHGRRASDGHQGSERLTPLSSGAIG